MGISDYVRDLREKIGHDYLLMPTVSALIGDDAGRLLLVRHVDGPWQLPGGAIDPDESPEDAVRRECREEASVEIRTLRIAGAFGGPDYRRRYTNGDEIGIVPIVFEAEIVGGTPRAGDDETQEVGWFAGHELDGLGLSAPSRAQLAALGLTA
jgi:8-oxo-dGTP pyrophosphatase MutT (NUDIX family)